MIALSLFVLAVQFAARPVEVVGQATTAICQTGFSWMFNSLNQSPCLLSSYLLLPCTSASTAFVFPLTAGEHYNLPTNSSISATPCRCNTVFYSTISACATCQGQEIYLPTWSDYSEFCPDPDISAYPEDISTGTAVPAWAYIDVRTLDKFTSIQAQAVANEGLPESTAPSSGPTATGGTTSAHVSGSAIGAPQSTTTSNGNGNNNGNDSGNNNTATKKSNNIGPIVGGVVGGVVGLLAITLAIWYCVRRQRNAARNAPTGPLDLTAGEYGQYAEKSGDFSQGGQGIPMPIASPLASPKVYNPDDPTTFPNTSDAQAASSRGSAAYSSPVQANYNEVPYSYPSPTGSPYSPVTVTGSGTNPTYKGVPEL
ncbi:hypothetical protein BC628DRAFT_1376975 [Trametes gibbosa]|nr:hypothetical protein BC628DRAFT_1376975 [Trametes gibbosa]